MPVSRTENLIFNRPANFLLRCNRYYHLATIGELDRVVDEVDEDLAKAQRVANEIRRQIVWRGDQKFQILILNLLTDDGG